MLHRTISTSSLRLQVSSHVPKVMLMLALSLTFVFTAIQSSSAQTYTVLHNFGHGKDGFTPAAGLFIDANGNLFGTTSTGLAGGVVFKLTSTGKETVLHTFSTGDGLEPLAGVIEDAKGNLYGTTFDGGASGFGTVFGLNKAGDEIMLYSFGGPPTDGEYSFAGLTQDKAGNLYGTTYLGGSAEFGTVFKITKNGKETVLANFSGPPDSAAPLAGVVLDATGNIYGTSTLGGSSEKGDVFKVTKAGKESVLYSFTGGKDGSGPAAGLILDSAGNLYGTTKLGGAFGAGTVFKVNKAGKETVLYSFKGLTDGSQPVAGLIQDLTGNFYGTTQMGGNDKQGVVFKLTSSAGGKWKETVLHSFTGGKDGGQPLGGVVQDGAGNLYGTASIGGKYQVGTAFKLTP
jgi:uncharacterized repeat protein (TIGR03803 family)